MLPHDALRRWDCWLEANVWNRRNLFGETMSRRQVNGKVRLIISDWKLRNKENFSAFRCFCFAATGERLFGWDWWRNADEMTCACSRQRHKAEVAGRLDVTLHCLPNGNFEALQCDMGICWCADEYDGHIAKDTFAVPEALWTYLACCKY